jgi:ferredoxin-NADP reductase
VVLSAGWQAATLIAAKDLTPHSRSLTFEVPDWGGNAAGQHADVRLTAPDGYRAVRSYSVATSGSGNVIELGVDRLPDGEVSPYLVNELRIGDQV